MLADPVTVFEAGLYPERVTAIVTVADSLAARPVTVTSSVTRDTEPLVVVNT